MYLGFQLLHSTSNPSNRGAISKREKNMQYRAPTINTWLAIVSWKGTSRCLVQNMRKQDSTFNPTPPAFKLTINTFGFLDGDLNSVMAAFLLLISMEPSNLYWSKRSLCRTTSMRSRKLVNWEKTTARKQGSWSRSRPDRSKDCAINVSYGKRLYLYTRRFFTRASNFVEEWKSFRRKVTSGCGLSELGNASLFLLLRTTSSSWLAYSSKFSHIQNDHV